MRTTVFPAIVSTLCGTTVAQRLTRSSESNRGRRDDAEPSGIPATIFKHPGTRRMAQHKRVVLPITIGNSADEETVGVLSKQATPRDRLMNNWSFLAKIYV